MPARPGRCSVSQLHLVFLVLVLASVAPGQEPEPVFHATGTLQTVPVRVIDRSGQDIDGLTAADFTVLENGKPQKIAFFGAERMPVSLAALLDTSRSMDAGDKLTRALALLTPLLRGNHADDEISSYRSPIRSDLSNH